MTATGLFLQSLPPLWGQSLCAVLLAISLSDILYRRVGNALVFCCMAWGITAHAAVLSPHAALFALGVGLVGFTLALPCFIVGGMGAADVKLVGALSVCAGPTAFASFILYTAVVAGLMGVWRLGRDGFFWQPRACAMLLASGPGALVRARASQTTLPLAVALSVGLGLALEQRGWGL